MRLRSPRQLTQDGPSGREAVHTLKVFCRRPISPMSAVGRKLSARERPNPSPKCGYPRRKSVAVVAAYVHVALLQNPPRSPIFSTMRHIYEPCIATSGTRFLPVPTGFTKSNTTAIA